MFGIDPLQARLNQYHSSDWSSNLPAPLHCCLRSKRLCAALGVEEGASSQQGQGVRERPSPDGPPPEKKQRVRQRCCLSCGQLALLITSCLLHAKQLSSCRCLTCLLVSESVEAARHQFHSKGCQMKHAPAQLMCAAVRVNQQGCHLCSLFALPITNHVPCSLAAHPYATPIVRVILPSLAQHLLCLLHRVCVLRP